MTIIALYVSIRLIYAVRKMTVNYYNTALLQIMCKRLTGAASGKLEIAGGGLSAVP